MTSAHLKRNRRLRGLIPSMSLLGFLGCVELPEPPSLPTQVIVVNQGTESDSLGSTTKRLPQISSTSPRDGANISLDKDLILETRLTSEPDGDRFSFRVYLALYSDSPDSVYAEFTNKPPTTESFTVTLGKEVLEPLRTYRWKVELWNEKGDKFISPIYSFSATKRTGSVYVGPEVYQGYPAVWFDFDGNRIIKEPLETTPQDADIWIEPNDPELSMTRSGLMKLVGEVPLESVTYAPADSEFRYMGYNSSWGYSNAWGDPEQDSDGYDYPPSQSPSVSSSYFKIGSAFVFRTHERNYGKLRISSLDPRRQGIMSFDFLYRIDGSKDLSDE